MKYILKVIVNFEVVSTKSFDNDLDAVEWGKLEKSIERQNQPFAVISDQIEEVN